MTAPTQPPDPRVQRIADALDVWSDTVGYESHRRLARVLVEELGGREGETAKDLPSWYRLTWDKITDALTSIDPEWYHSRKDIGTHAADTIRTLAAQQRENAETIAALKGELKLARADRDFWKDEHNKACELAGQRAAELDAIKGAQVPFAYGGNNADGFPVISLSAQAGLPPLYRHPAPPHNPFAAFIDALKADRDMQWYYHCNVAMAACDKGVPHDQANAAAFLFMERLLGEYTPLHAIPEYTPAPPLPVVGACVVNDKGEVTHRWSDRWLARDMDVLEVIARKENGTLYKLLLGDKIGAPLPTEGGK